MNEAQITKAGPWLKVERSMFPMPLAAPPMGNLAWQNFKPAMTGIGNNARRTARRNHVIDRQNVAHDKRYAALVFCQRGWELGKRGQFEKAIDCFDRAIKIDPKNAHAHQLRGGALSLLNRFEGAIAAFDRAINIDPKHVHALFGRGWALVKLSHYDDGLVSISQALELAPTNVELLGGYSWALAQAGFFEKALNAVDRAISLDPDNAHALELRSEILAQLNRYDEAFSDIDRAISLKPQNSYFYEVRGAALGRGGYCKDEAGRRDEAALYYKKALDALDRAINLDPQNVGALVKRAAVLQISEAPKEDVLDAANGALRIDPDNREAINLRAVALGGLKRYTEAFESLDRAISLEPENNAIRKFRKNLEIIRDTEEGNKLADEQLRLIRDKSNEAQQTTVESNNHVDNGKLFWHTSAVFQHRLFEPNTVSPEQETRARLAQFISFQATAEQLAAVERALARESEPSADLDAAQKENQPAPAPPWITVARLPVSELSEDQLARRREYERKKKQRYLARRAAKAAATPSP